MPDTEPDSSSFDDEELHLVYERCQAVTDRLDLHNHSSQGLSNHRDSDSEEDIDEDDLNFIFTKYQDMMDHIDISKGHVNPSHDIPDSNDVDEDDLVFVFTKCQDMMEHIDLNHSLSEDKSANGEGDYNESSDDYVDQLSYRIPSPPPLPCHPLTLHLTSKRMQMVHLHIILSVSHYHLYSVIYLC